MFDFLKKLFGKKPEPVKQNTEPNLPVHVSNDVKKPAAESLLQKPSVSKYTDQNRPGVALEIQRPRKLTDDYPQNSAPAQTSRPTVQPTRSAVQPVQPVAQPTQPVVKPPVKPTVKYESRPAWTAEQKTTAAKPAVAPVQTKPRPQVVAPRSQPGRVAPSAGKRVQKTSVYIGLDFGTTFTKAAYEIAPSNVHIKYSVRFGKSDKNEDYYLPSVLYFDSKAQKLKIFDPDENCEEILY